MSVSNEPTDDKPIFDAGDVSKMGADAPNKLDLPPHRPPVLVIRKKIRVRFKTEEQYLEREMKTREEFRRADARSYRGRTPVGSGASKTADRIRLFARDHGLSVKGGFAKLAPDVDGSKPKPAPEPIEAFAPVAQHTPGKCGHCHASTRGKRAGALFCSPYCSRMASRSAKQAAKAAADRVFDSTGMIAANTNAQQDFVDRTSAERSRLAAALAAQGDRPGAVSDGVVRSGASFDRPRGYVMPRRGRKRDNSFLPE
jgi:hypothetical protein